jgi:hypothetical protein
MPFIKATRRKSKLRLWLSGMSSSGKTYSALLIAKGFGGKTAMIDTEAGRGNLYGQEFDYDILELQKPFTPEKYVAALKEAEKAGYETVIVDSTSHEWIELLEIKGKIDESGGNSFTNWNQPTRRHNAFIEAVVQSPCHVILTSRVKRDYVLEENDKGKKVPKLIGLANVQRDGFEYEATAELRLDERHRAVAIKDNTRLFSRLDEEGVLVTNEPFIITEDTGKRLRDWLMEGDDEPCAKCQKDGTIKPSVGQADNGKSYCETCLKEYEEYKQSQLKEADKKE